MGGRGSSSATSKASNDNRAKQLDKNLIERANNSTFIVDGGTSVEKQYKSAIEEIDTLYLSEQEKKEARDNAYDIATNQLNARADNPSWVVTGRANLNVKKARIGGDKIAEADQKMRTFLSGLRETSSKNKNQYEAMARKKAIEIAIANKEPVFRVRETGEILYRKSSRGNNWYRVYDESQLPKKMQGIVINEY